MITIKDYSELAYNFIKFLDILCIFVGSTIYLILLFTRSTWFDSLDPSILDLVLWKVWKSSM